ncbi:MAG: glycosyltransferase family 2 protein [Acidobacteria bacterium]|nr:glycosyltransferase family 2 protein [Acidobacteriota bacterium]
MAEPCSDHPFVSVIVCTLPQRPLLEKCLDSLRAQVCQRSEVLVVLNSAPEEAFAQRISRYPVRLLHEPRRGVCRARNRAIPHAQGDLLAFLDDDVVAHPGWLHDLIRGFEAPDVACVIGRVLPEGPNYAQNDRGDSMFFGERALSSWYAEAEPGWYEQFLAGAIVGFGCNMAFRKQFLLTQTLFPEDLGAGSIIGAEDENFMFFQVLRQGLRIYHTPQAVVSHRFEEDRGQQRSRLKQIRAATVAFRLKLLVEEKQYRLATARSLATGLARTLESSFGRKRSSETLRPLSPTETLLAHLRGFRVYWQSRRRDRPPRSQP